MAGQWRVVSGFAVGYIDLDYGAVESAMNMHGVAQKKRKQLFADLRVMAAAALKVLNRKRDE